MLGRLGATWAAMMLLSTTLAAPRANAAAICDAACLTAFVDAYMSALAAHDAGKAPLASNVKFTENGVRLSPTDGLWKTAGATRYRLYQTDVRSQGAGLQAVLDEDGKPVMFQLRIRVAAGRIVEAETIICREGGARLFAPEALTRSPPLFARAEPVAEQLSRARLTAIADAYFTALETEATPEFKQAPLAANAERFENGRRTTNVSLNGGPARTALQQFEQGAFKDNLVTDRRYLLIDTEKNTVLAVVVFRGKPGAERPKDLLLAEMFKIEHGLIKEIQAVMVDVPKGAATGWAP